MIQMWLRVKGTLRLKLRLKLKSKIEPKLTLWHEAFECDCQLPT
jgi:hypothetical protein